MVGDRSQPLGVGGREETLGDALQHDESDASIPHLQRRAEHRAGGTEGLGRLVDDHRLPSVVQLADHGQRVDGRRTIRWFGVAEADPAAGDLQALVGTDENDRREVIGHQPLHSDEHLLHHLVGVECLGHRARRVTQGLGVRPLLALLGLHADAVVDLPAEALDGPLEITSALLNTLVEILERAVEALFGRSSLGDVFERAEDADDLTIAIA